MGWLQFVIPSQAKSKKKKNQCVSYAVRIQRQNSNALETPGFSRFSAAKRGTIKQNQKSTVAMQLGAHSLFIYPEGV
jgi:hypothetical protein